MSDSAHEPVKADAGFDLTQFFQVFFEEAGENLDTMEQMLLGIDLAAADDEELNAIFRCAHSVKGGAATFGFSDVAALTHQMETLLDKLRRHELEPSAVMVDVLLQARDALKAQLARHQGGGAGESVETEELLASFRALIAGQAPAAAATAHGVHRQSRNTQGVEVASGRAFGHLELVGDLGGGHLPALLQEQQDRHESVGTHRSIFSRKPVTT